MLSLITNNTQIALTPGTKLRFEVASPVFSTGVITAAVVYPFDLPVVGNEAIFECAHFLEANRKYKSTKCILKYSGVINCSGELILSKINSKRLRASFIGNAFAIDVKDKSIREFKLPSETIPSDPYHPRDISQYATKVVKEEIQSMFQFPKMWAELFYGNEDGDGRSQLNPDYGRSYYQEIDGKFINNYSGASAVFGFPFNEIREDPDPTNIFSLVPCPFLYKSLQYLVESQGYQIFGDFITNTEIQKILISNNTPIDKLYPAYFVKASNVTEIQSTSLTEYTKILFNNDFDIPNEDEYNCWNIATSEYTIKEPGYHHMKFTGEFMVHVSQALPNKRLSLRFRVNQATTDHLTQETSVLETWLPCSLETTVWFPDSWVGLPLYFDVTIQEWQGEMYGWVLQAGDLRNVSCEIINVSKNEYNAWTNVLSLADHLPGITFSEFLNAIKDTFSLAIWIDNNSKEVQVGFTKDVINSPYYLDLTDNVIGDSHETDIKEPQGKKLTFDNDEFQTTEGKDYIEPFTTFKDRFAPNRLNVLALVQNLNVLYHYTLDENNIPLWVYYADNFYPYITGENTKEISIKLSPVVMHQKNANHPEDVICPKLKEVSNSSAFNPEYSEMPFRIMLWLGMQENYSGYQYPMASSTGLTYKGDRIVCLDLNWKGDHGIIEKYYKPLLDLTNSQEITTVDFSIKPHEMDKILNLFRPQKGNNEVRKIRISNKNYIPKKATFQLTSTGIEQTEIELISKNDQ